jgi:hypothetical protein
MAQDKVPKQAFVRGGIFQRLWDLTMTVNTELEPSGFDHWTASNRP